MFNVILICFGIYLIVVGFFQHDYKKLHTIKKSAHKNFITVVIPYKNEFNRILPLIHSINKTAVKHKKTNLFKHLQFIFIDDHSTDKTTELILKSIDVECQIIRLRNTNGKKYAIKKGVEMAKFDLILTLDADIEFDTDYLLNITNIQATDLTILPVKMKGENLLQNIFSIEFDFLQFLTFGFSKFNNYILCNGANLLFTKALFLDSLTRRKDAKIIGGDDYFLLAFANLNNASIQALNKTNLTVTTKVEKTFKNNINQRIRWIKKAISPSVVFGVLLVFILNLLFLYAIYESCSNTKYLLIIFIKIGTELIMLNNYKKIIALVFHQIYYPIYLFILLSKLPFKKVTWR